MEYQTAAQCQQAGVTLHMTPTDVWERQRSGPTYLPESYAADGFIHCTDGLETLLAVGNSFYQTDPRPYVVFVVDCAMLSSPLQYDDASGLFPHIYGPIQTAAIREVAVMDRSPDGEFLSMKLGADLA